MRAVLLLLLGTTSCTIQRTPAEPESVVVTPPAEDGTRYVAVHGGPVSSPGVLARQWKRQAKRACGGDYVLINDEPGVTRRGGVIAQRMHEGFVRCVFEDEELGGPPVKASAKQRAATARSQSR